MENLRKNAESRQSDSKFMKLQAGEKKNVLDQSGWNTTDNRGIQWEQDKKI